MLVKAKTMETYGRLDFGINNAGVIRTPMVERLLSGQPEAEAGFVAMEPVGRMGKPEEIATAVVWLCSDAASFVTGHPMVVDGGFVAQ